MRRRSHPRRALGRDRCGTGRSRLGRRTPGGGAVPRAPWSAAAGRRVRLARPRRPSRRPARGAAGGAGRAGGRAGDFLPRSALPRLSPASWRRNGSAGIPVEPANASGSTAFPSRSCTPAQTGPGGARTSTRTRWFCWSSTATSRRCSRATPVFPPRRPCGARSRPVDLLKVGHHGSRGSTGPGWLEQLRPAVAVISVGRNEYGHPAPATMARLGEAGVAIRRTDEDGTVSVRTDGRTMTVRAGNLAETYDVGDEQATPAAHFKSNRGRRADIRDHDRAIHRRPGASLSRGDGGALEPALRHRARRQDHRGRDPARRPRQHPGHAPAIETSRARSSRSSTSSPTRR